MTIGILGAGKVGIVLAQLALKAGYRVLIAGSGDPAKIALTVKILAPGAVATTNTDAAHQADVIIAAIPLNKFKTLPKEALQGKLVIDAMNHWFEVDGPRDDTIPASASSSEAVQAWLENARVVKALSHMGYHELHDETRPDGNPDRKAIAIAADSPADATQVAALINAIGFDPVVIGTLAHGIVLEPGQPGFGANVDAETLQLLVSSS